jgi:hypothetical protein
MAEIVDMNFSIAGFVAVAKPDGTGSPTPAGKFAAACVYIFAVAYCVSQLPIPSPLLRFLPLEPLDVLERDILDCML